MAIVIFIIIILIIAILVYLFFSLGLIRVEIKPDPANGAQESETLDKSADGEENPSKLVDLFEMFGEEEEQGDEKSGEAKSDKNQKEDLVYDKLTDLMTLPTFLSEAGKLLDVAKQNGAPYAMAYFDIERFSFINSIKGYSLGDFVLSRLGQEIRSIFPAGSQFARVSADHFAVIFPINDDPPFEAYSDLVKKACEKIRLDMAIKSSIRVCMGIAVTESPSNPISYSTNVLMRKANIARHCLKASKSESYSLYDETMISTSLYGESLLDDYAENQYGDDFIIRFQSVTDLTRKRIAGCDPLVRWTCQDDNANEPMSADNGRIPTNVTKVIYHTFRSASRWRKQEKECVPIYMYITETEFFRPDLDEFLARCLDEFQIEPGIVYLAVDANVVRIDWTISNRQIKRLRDTGLKVGVSGIDVNTKSLEFLAGLPINFIKLNSGFSLGINKSTEKADAVRAMMVMAQAQNLRVVFEGVNTIEQMQEHMKLGSGLVEGRCNGQPMLPDEFIKMLDDYSPAAKGTDSTVILNESSFNQGDYRV